VAGDLVHSPVTEDGQEVEAHGHPVLAKRRRLVRPVVLDVAQPLRGRLGEQHIDAAGARQRGCSGLG
jgi:hypothetical protein